MSSFFTSIAQKTEKDYGKAGILYSFTKGEGRTKNYWASKVYFAVAYLPPVSP
jgi:hypothetical protein